MLRLSGEGSASGGEMERSPHFSESAVFVAKVNKRQKNQLTSSYNRQQAHQNIQNVRNNRSFENEKLTSSGIYSYSGISQTNVH